LTVRLTFAFLTFVGLSACGDPIADIARLSDQNIPETTTSVGAIATPGSEEGGLFDRLLEDGAGGEASPADDAAEPARPTGFLARLIGGQSASPQPPDAQVIEASAPEPDMVTAKPGASKSTPAVVSEIPAGTMLPYGRVARICGLAKRDLGKEIAQYPEKSPFHRIYDSDPGNTSPHSFFITGFDDGCARQFTASLALFGPVAMHEQLRYGLPSDVQPYSDTDKAYEKLKSRVCGVPRQKPCGSKVSKLDRNTVFVSIYERFGSNPNWSNLLLHKGKVLAQDRKNGG